MQKKQALEFDRSQGFRGISEHRSLNISKALLHGCGEQTVRTSIFALRRGPVRYRRGAMIACEGDPTDYVYRSSAAWSEVVGPTGTVTAASSLLTCRASFLDGAANYYIHSLWKPQQIRSCCFSNAALCLPPPCMTAELQVIFWPLRQMSFDARNSLPCW